MQSIISLNNNMDGTPPLSYSEQGSLAVRELTHEHEAEVLNFLALRPLHTVAMVSLIRDNGLISPFNRGTFYACRDEATGELEGVALIGHATLIETRSEAGLAAFAPIARECERTHVIMGERDKLEDFWYYYAEEGESPRVLCRELLFEQRVPEQGREIVSGLRRATLADLHLIAPVQAGMALEESGVNPLEKDPEGFRARCARRIEQGRSWVWVEDGRLIFKADIIAETSEVVYLEGVYVNPQERGKGYGQRCMAQLGRTLLARVKSICLLVNEQNEEAAAFYRKAGYKLRSYYDTIYMQHN
ncbi:MAG: GNAT family N-acetyltransferase [Acidobacteria bacterium]|nr:GNAT family N-acetyltransferase [Acidobacteriota bacterium]